MTVPIPIRPSRLRPARRLPAIGAPGDAVVVRFFTRRRLNWTGRYPAIAAAYLRILSLCSPTWLW
jgi:hypothetical protein